MSCLDGGVSSADGLVFDVVAETDGAEFAADAAGLDAAERAVEGGRRMHLDRADSDERGELLYYMLDLRAR